LSLVKCVDCDCLVSIGSRTCPKCGCIDPWRDKPIITYDPNHPDNAEREKLSAEFWEKKRQKDEAEEKLLQQSNSNGCIISGIIIIFVIIIVLSFFYYNGLLFR